MSDRIKTFWNAHLKDYVSLFLLFAKIGSVTFGGGYAMLPILQRELVENRGWCTDEELMDYFAIGQCTPGIIAVNVSTFVGNKRKGVLGGILATVGFASIPILLLIIIAAFLQNFAEYQIVKDAFAGVRVAVCVLIVNAAQRLWKKSIFNLPTFLIFLGVFLLSVFADLLPVSVSPAILVVLAAFAGILLGRWKGEKKS